MLGTSLSHYRIVFRLGAGGMGEVYLAEDSRLGRRVAIKVLREGSAEGVRRLKHEAQLAASLDHPNICSIYEVGEDSGQHFIAMQYVEGESLAARLRQAPIGVGEALELALPIADALAEAHQHGIVHRDVKPHNIMIGPRHQVKVLDFGLAKPWSGGAAATSESPTFTSLTQSGALTGTLAYMSPEQARAERLDARSDIFSFGAMLHEILTGRPLFARGNPAETLSAILTFEPPALDRAVQGVPGELERIVSKALRKDREERYQDIRDLRIDLAALREDREFRARLERSREEGADARVTLRDPGRGGSAPGVARPRRRFLLPAAAALAIAAALGAAYLHRANLAWADASLARVDELARAGDYAAAYDLAQRIRRYRPESEELKKLLPLVTDDLSVSTEPSGALVRLERFEPREDRAQPAPLSVGRTPVSHVAIPRGDYVVRVELAGHERFERTISSSVARGEFGFTLSPAIQVATKLFESGKVPPRMIPVPGGPYKLVGYGQPTQTGAVLGDYFIDKYEVSNREYKEFVDAGGYRERGFWKYPFVKDGKSLSWEQAMPLFVDRTGLPGPRNWSGGNPPDGKADHPVTGVSWYESAAYAAFRGKALPSIYQWEKAARDGAYYPANWTMPWGLMLEKSAAHRANFESSGTLPVDQLAFGMSPFGGYNMAGNVTEWVSNETSTGFAAGGGSWADPPYIFGDYGTFPGFFSSDRLGFRCALTAPGVTGDQGGARISAAEQAPVYPRSSDAQFQAFLTHYRYDRTPLEAKVEETIETADWKRERVSYLGAGGERAFGYLFLPKGPRPPFQVIQFVPGSGAYNGRLPFEFVEEGGRLAPIVKGGRAVFVVTLRGYTGRPWPAGHQRPDRSAVAFRDQVVKDATDLRRGLDYLETRLDVDRTRLAFMNASISWQGLIFSAIEPRYRSVVLMASGLYPNQVGYVAEANPIHFAPHIRPPKLMLNGRWDEDFAFKTEAEPLFKLLREPKRLELFDGGHVPPVEVTVPILNRWFDETLGPVKAN